MDNGEEKKLNNQIQEEEFKDFDDEEVENLPIEDDFSNVETTKPQDELQEAQEVQENMDLDEKKTVEEQKKSQDLSIWEEFDENNAVVKKYIFYVSKDFVPIIDELTLDERSAYINDAIQKKIDLENEQKQKELKRKLVIHFILMVLTICLSAPFVIFLAHKAIIATFDNYKYSQENFEKLYKQRFEKDRAYMRSIQYNKALEAKNKKH